MSGSDESEILLTQVAKLHHENGFSQQAIAGYLGLSKMTISRMLQRAKELDIVQVRIRFPFALSAKLSEAIEKAYSISRAIVVKGSYQNNDELRALIGRVAAFHLCTGLLDRLVLGVGVGKTIGQVIQSLTPIKAQNLHIVQLMGGLTDVSNANPFTIVQEACRKLNAKGTYLSSSAVMETAEDRQNLLYKTKMGEEMLALWKRCGTALFGVGSIESGTLISDILVKPQELEVIKHKGGKGDILGHCFDEKGVFIETGLEERLVSIPVPLLLDIKERLAVAAGEEKACAIRGALRSGIITMLITEERTAARLI